MARWAFNAATAAGYAGFLSTFITRGMALPEASMALRRLTGQSLLRAEANPNECNRSTARKKIGPVNQPCDRPIDVISIASLMFLVTSGLADQRTKTLSCGRIAPGGEQKVDRLPGGIQRSIQILVLAFDLDVGLVDPIALVDRLQIWTR